MTRTFFAIVLVICFLGGHPSADAAHDITGPWQSVEFAGVASVDNKCTYITLRDYRYLFSPESNGLRRLNFSIAETKLWLTMTTPDCAFPGESPDQRSYLRILRWDGFARSLDGTRWEVGTDPGRCSLQGCSGTEQLLGPIHGELARVGFQMLDRRDGRPAGAAPVAYRPLPAAERLAESAATAVPELMKGLDEGNCFNWYQTTWSARAMDPSKISALCALEKEFKDSTGPVLETRIVSSWTLGPNPQQASSPDNVALVAGAAIFGNGTNLGRVLVLIQEGDAWRILKRFGR